jgi:hypothetical protein
VPLIWQWDENFDIGADTGTPVSDDYQVPFWFAGKITKLTLRIDRAEAVSGGRAEAEGRNAQTRERPVMRPVHGQHNCPI